VTPPPDPAADGRRERRERARRRTRQRRRLAVLAAAALAAGLATGAAAGGPAGEGARAGAKAPPAATAAAATPADTAAPEADGRPGTTSTAAAAERRRASRAAGAAVDRALRRTWFAERGARRTREVALTFDDGPGPDTPRLLSWLRRHRVPATFFLLGSAARRDPATVRRILREGHAVGAHTSSHALLPRLSAAGQRAEIAGSARDIEAITGRRVRLFRPPYGGFDATTRAILREERMLMVLWTVDTRDFERPGSARIAYTALSGARAGSIVLMHDGGGRRAQTLKALTRIVKGVRSRGLRLVTVPDLLAGAPVPRDQGPATSRAG
jgi:peptidoglycan/xylan/chitin deacetylase (PgdA/CDA1 family)